MGRTEAHVAACGIAAAILLACAHGAVALAEPTDSAGSQNTNSTTSGSGPGPSANTTGNGTENAKTVSPPSEAAKIDDGSARESDTEGAGEKKPDNDGPGTDPGKTINRVPALLPEAPPPVNLAPLPVAPPPPPLEVPPPPVDLPPALPAEPVNPDTVDAKAGGASTSHSHGNEPPVLTLPFVAAPAMAPGMHILGASVASRGISGEPIVKWTPKPGGEPTSRLLQASASEPLVREPPPTNGGLAARTQASDRTGYNTKPLAEMAAAALPGIAGIVIMTASGILLGYRQAKMAQLLRPDGADRFLD